MRNSLTPLEYELRSKTGLVVLLASGRRCSDSTPSWHRLGPWCAVVNFEDSHLTAAYHRTLDLSDPYQYLSKNGL